MTLLWCIQTPVKIVCLVCFYRAIFSWAVCSPSDEVSSCIATGHSRKMWLSSFTLGRWTHFWALLFKCSCVQELRWRNLANSRSESKVDEWMTWRQGFLYQGQQNRLGLRKIKRRKKTHNCTSYEQNFHHRTRNSVTRGKSRSCGRSRDE